MRDFTREEVLMRSLCVLIPILISVSWTGSSFAKDTYVNEKIRNDPNTRVATSKAFREVEPNDSCVQSQPAQWGTIVDLASIGDAGDVDFYELRAGEGASLTIRIEPCGSLPTVRTSLRIVGDDCETILASDDSDGGEFNSVIRDFTTPYSGSYYVTVLGQGSATGHYRLLFEIKVPDEGGACCLPGGRCAIMDRSTCDCAGGIYHGFACNPSPCEGVCCRGASCHFMTRDVCEYYGGYLLSEHEVCDPNPCQIPARAVCCADGECAVLSEEDCNDSGGQWLPEYVVCLPSICHEQGPPCPPGWIDSFDETHAVFLFEVPGVVEKRPIIAVGPTTVVRNPVGFEFDGKCLIETEITELDLVGIYDPADECDDLHTPRPATVTLDSLGAYGVIISSVDSLGSPTYPDSSWFDVRVLVTIEGLGTFPHRIDLGNILNTADLWSDPPCVDPEGPYVSPSRDHAHIPCPEEDPEGCCVLGEEIGNGCFTTSEVICDLLEGVYIGDGIECPPPGMAVEEGRTPSQAATLEIIRNPSSDGADISFRLPRDGHVKLEVYDSSGRRILGLVDRHMPAGIHTYTWDGGLAGGYEIPAGVYFVRLQTAAGKHVRKAMILR
jgi:hypothetical protein